MVKNYFRRDDGRWVIHGPYHAYYYQEDTLDDNDLAELDSLAEKFKELAEAASEIKKQFEALKTKEMDLSWPDPAVTPILGPSALSTKIPGINEKAVHPITSNHLMIRDIIINLNDVYKWKREQIADWLETLDEVPGWN